MWADGKPQRRHLFLFNDLLICTQELQPEQSEKRSARRPPHFYQAEGIFPLLRIKSVHEMVSIPRIGEGSSGVPQGDTEHEPERLRVDVEESGGNETFYCIYLEMVAHVCLSLSVSVFQN